MAKKNQKKQKSKKKLKKFNLFKSVFSWILSVCFFALLFVFFWKAGSIPQHQISISSDNFEQGDTIVLKVSGKYPWVNGLYNEESIPFFRKGESSDWSAILGIDINEKPGLNKIFIDAYGEKLEKEVVINEKEFPSKQMALSKQLDEKGYTKEKIIENVVNTDNPALNEVLTKFTPEAYFDGSFAYPLDNIKKAGFGFGDFIRSGTDFLRHFGVDLKASDETRVYAINDGKVVLVKNLSNYGKTIVIDHGVGIYSLYLHLSSFDVSLNQQVKKKQQIALSGSTGYSTGPHLHFSIRDNKARVDPVLFIERTKDMDYGLNFANISKAFLNVFR